MNKTLILMMISLSFGLGYIMAEFKSIQPNEHTAPNTHHERYSSTAFIL